MARIPGHTGGVKRTHTAPDAEGCDHGDGCTEWSHLEYAYRCSCGHTSGVRKIRAIAEEDRRGHLLKIRQEVGS